MVRTIIRIAREGIMILDRLRHGRHKGHGVRSLLAAGLLVALAACGWAQGTTAPADAVGVLTLKSEPTGALIELTGAQQWRGMTPCDFNRGLKGPYRLTAKMRLYERWSRNLNLAAGESREVTIRLTPKSAWKAAVRSMIVPGWGQFYAEEPGKGTLLLGAAGVAAGGLLWTHLVYRERVDDYDAARERYFNSTHYEDLADLRASMVRADKRAGDAYDLRQGFLYATAACSAISFLDALFFFPSRSEGAFATIRPFGDGGPDLALRPAPGGSLRAAIVLRENHGGAR
jgi:hypothetical protein